MGRDLVVYPTECGPQRRRHGAVLVVDDDETPAMPVNVVQQRVEVNGVGPRHDVADAAPLALDVEEPGELRAQVIDVHTQTGRDFHQARVLLGGRLPEDDRELSVYFALALTGLTISSKLIARVPAGPAILALYFLALLLRLRRFLAGFLRFAFLAATLCLLLLPLPFTRLLLVGLDLSLDHLLQLRLGDAVSLGVVRQPKHLPGRRLTT